MDTLTYHDHFLISKDFDSYCDAQALVEARWRDQKGVAALDHPQHRARRLVLVGSRDKGICAGDMERADGVKPRTRDNGALAFGWFLYCQQA